MIKSQALLCVVVFGLTGMLFAQDAKVAPKDVAPVPTVMTAPSERPLTEAESLKIQLLAAKIELLQKQYQIEKFQADVAPLTAEQNSIVTAACKSVGVKPEEMQTTCGLATGVGQDGKPIVGPDGKQVAARVWRQQPPPSSKSDK